MVGELADRSRTGGKRMQVAPGETTTLCRTRRALRDIESARQLAVQLAVPSKVLSSSIVGEKFKSFGSVCMYVCM